MQKSHLRLLDSFSVILKRIFLLTLALCSLLPFLSTAHAGEKAQSTAQTPGTPQRIVVFPLFAEEMLLEMIGPGRIVFVGHEYWENGEAYTPTMALTKGIRGSSDPDICAADFLNLKPDLVVLEKANYSIYETLLPELQQAGIPFLFLDIPQSMDDILSALTTLGEAVGAKDMAAQMVRNMEATLAQITQIVSTIAQEKRVRAAYFDYSHPECYIPNNFSIIARAAGVINASGSDTDYKQMNDALLKEWNPDLITFIPFFLDGPSLYDIGDEFVEKRISSILNNPQLSAITAIKNRNVHPLSLHESQFIVQSVQDLARLAYPDLFTEH